MSLTINQCTAVQRGEDKGKLTMTLLALNEL
jgi:hypothetical protein